MQSKLAEDIDMLILQYIVELTSEYQAICRYNLKRSIVKGDLIKNVNLKYMKVLSNRNRLYRYVRLTENAAYFSNEEPNGTEQ